MEEDDKFIPSRLIDEQEKDYEDIYALSHSEYAKILGTRQYMDKHNVSDPKRVP
mgnify:CR=1 FL=1